MSKRNITSRNENINDPDNMQTGKTVGTVQPRVRRAVRPQSRAPITPTNTNNNVIPWLGSEEYNNYTKRVSNKYNTQTRDILIPEEYIKLKIFQKFLENSIEYLPSVDRITASNNLSKIMYYLQNPQIPVVQKTNEPSEKRRDLKRQPANRIGLIGQPVTAY